MIFVAPLAGAWIEISRSEKEICPLKVAPLAGAWIEILQMLEVDELDSMSLPSRERGLK